MSLAITSQPATEPLSTAEAKSHLRVDISDDDTLIDSYVKAARLLVERAVNRQLITATYRLKMDDFDDPRYAVDSRSIVIPRAPLQSVSSIQYLDTDGSTQTLASSKYTVYTDSLPGRIVLNQSEVWPAVQQQTWNTVTITFVAGYGNAASDVPETLRSAIRLLVGHFYENREAAVVGMSAKELPLSVKSLLATEKVQEFV